MSALLQSPVTDEFDAMSGRCRLCHGRLSSQTLHLAGVPESAQAFCDSVAQARDRRIDLDIAACCDCGLVQSRSRPIGDYRRVITAAGMSPGMRAHRQRQFSDFVSHYALRGSSCVEVGCGRGDLLALLAASGLRPVGMEFGGDARMSGGYRVLDAYPENGKPLPGAPYDSFVCLNFLEHAPDPRGFLDSIAQSLCGSAAGLVEVPNFDQQRRLGRSFDYVADHLSYFDRESLALALSLSGFTVDRIAECRDGENLEAWVRRRQAPGFDEDQRRIDRIRTALQSELNASRAASGRMAIWGASHQALTLLAGVDCTALLGIFDSAPFKQGRFAPASGLAILAPTPEALRAVNDILIIASGYEQEIAGHLRGPCSFCGRIRSLRGTEFIDHE